MLAKENVRKRFQMGVLALLVPWMVGQNFVPMFANDSSLQDQLSSVPAQLDSPEIKFTSVALILSNLCDFTLGFFRINSGATVLPAIFNIYRSVDLGAGDTWYDLGEKVEIFDLVAIGFALLMRCVVINELSKKELDKRLEDMLNNLNDDYSKTEYLELLNKALYTYRLDHLRNNKLKFVGLKHVDNGLIRRLDYLIWRTELLLKSMD